MNLRRQITCLFPAIGILILVLDGKTALSGAADGIELCLRTVIPALFPFFVLSSALLRDVISFPFLEKSSMYLFGLPKGTGMLALPCFFGGYPVGARSVYQAYADGYLQKKEAERLLAFCNNAGPSFLFGVVGQMFPKTWMPWAMWGIHLVGARIAAYCISSKTAATYSVKEPQHSESGSMSEAVHTMALVCGWVIIFRVLIAFMDKWFLWLLPSTVRVLFIGLLELSNGCCELPGLSSISMRFILCSGMLAAGGLCVTAQTVSVTPGLSLRYYCAGKLIQIVVSLICSYSLVNQTPLPLLSLLFFYPIGKKRSGNRLLAGV